LNNSKRNVSHALDVAFVDDRPRSIACDHVGIVAI
jgi:hypothetical protein